MYTYDPTMAFRDAAGELCVKDAELTPVEGREHVKILRDLPPQWAKFILLYNKTEVISRIRTEGISTDS
jgi:hypothetical protein